ncbi:MAG: SDR family NAD(P)-dependent oxidoreductase, partial [Alphaproteobacteria bacterium]|nr:SDR family NAD(P)-dependent oxidoreductase [Alphaproteobacteria bacterium]
KSAMAAWIAREDDEQPIDLVIANAGIGISHRDGLALGEVAERIFAVNVEGVFNTVHPAIERMTPRKRGQIAVVSSLAGYQGLASAPAYSASKSAVKAYAEGLRGHLAPLGLEVSAICPGFVESRLTARNDFSMPFLMAGDAAARLIARKLARNKGRISFPLPLLAAVRVMSLLPMGLIDLMARRLPKK